jgi:PTH2 family peptidyl-tRNA hydrolase
MDTKQVIVMRKDLNMRKGKMIAQGSHASMAFLTKGMYWASVNDGFEFSTETIYDWREVEEINHWLNNSFRKICVYVNSEEELRELHQKALDNGLISHMITDNGATEFNGVKTLTALAIGPHWDSKFEGITDKLPLL